MYCCDYKDFMDTPEDFELWEMDGVLYKDGEVYRFFQRRFPVQQNHQNMNLF